MILMGFRFQLLYDFIYITAFRGHLLVPTSAYYTPYMAHYKLSPFCVPFYQHGLTLIPAWISNYTHYNMLDEITYPFLTSTVEV